MFFKTSRAAGAPGAVNVIVMFPGGTSSSFGVRCVREAMFRYGHASAEYGMLSSDSTGL